ncbi:MAG: nucleotidyl transferase AbiEii/AbiGii toxin family protein [Bacteroidota bacterium]
MLHFETIAGETLDLLKGIQELQIGDLRLVGGTALALQYGHRQSVDLDFFGTLTDESFESIFKSLIRWLNEADLREN